MRLRIVVRSMQGNMTNNEKVKKKQDYREKQEKKT